MAASDPRAPKPYALAPEFQRSVAALAARSPRFWGRVGAELRHDRFSDAPSSLCLRAVFLIAQEQGSGPSSGVAVQQRLRALVNDGKVTHEEAQAVGEMLAEAADVPEDELVAGLAPVIQQDLRDQAVRAGIEAFGRKQDLESVVELEDRARRFGRQEASQTLEFGAQALSAIRELKRVATLPYGVWELDNMDDAGLPRGGLGIFIGGTGSGKSHALIHVSTNAFWTFEGIVAYATLEIPTEMVMARSTANLIGVPINELVRDPDRYAARAELAREAARGKMVTRKFTPLVTRVPDLAQWVDELEQQHGKRVGLLAVDYGDKVGAPKKNGEDQSGYSTGLVVFESLRTLAEQRDMFCWTASQATRKKDKKRRIDVDDVADSMHKVRVADMVVTINPYGEEGSREVKYFLAKSRYGSDRVESNPVQTDFARGRMGPPTHGCSL